MGRKKTFESRIIEADEFIKAGNLKSAISTLLKAQREDPVKTKATDLKARIAELKKQLEAQIKLEEKPDAKDVIQPDGSGPKEETEVTEPPIEEKPDEQSEEDKLEEERQKLADEKLREELKKEKGKPKEKPAEEDLDSDELIDFRVLRPFTMNNELQVTDRIIELPRSRKDFSYVIALEDE